MDQKIGRYPFFDLLRIACGTQQALSRQLSETEWETVFRMSKKQSLTGVMFAAVQSLDSEYCPSKDKCREWIRNAEPLRKKNRLASERSAQLYSMLSENGFSPCIMKGQSLAPYYGELAEYRAVGDIDVWVDKPISAIDGYVSSLGVKHHTTIAHVECDIFPDIPVEIHPQPAIIRCPWLDKRLQDWFKSFDVSQFEMYNGYRVAPLEFNLVYMLVHIQHHLLFEGVGLRQLMDYFFVLKAADRETVRNGFDRMVSCLQLKPLARGIMWIMREVFGLDSGHLLADPDEKMGRFLLDEIMIGGNFGMYDTRNRMVKSRNPVARAWGGVVRNARFFSMASSVVICNPFWRMWHFVWKRRFYN